MGTNVLHIESASIIGSCGNTSIRGIVGHKCMLNMHRNDYQFSIKISMLL